MLRIKSYTFIGHGSVPEVTLAVTKTIFRQAYTGQGASQSVSIACYNGNVSASTKSHKDFIAILKMWMMDNRRECITCPLFSKCRRSTKGFWYRN